MNRLQASCSPAALRAALYAAALSVWVAPALALAQAQGKPPAGAAPMDSPARNAGGGAGWLWIVAALVVLALVWWAMTSRRRDTAARTRH